MLRQILKKRWLNGARAMGTKGGKGTALPFIHRVTKRHSNGDVTIYIYAHRGGALLASYRGADLKAATRLERASATELIKKYALQAEKPAPKALTLHDLIQRYRADVDGLQRLRDSTRKEWERILGTIDGEFGTLPLKLLKTERARSIFKEWRNGMAETPRKADYSIQVLSRVINYGREERLVEANPVASFKKAVFTLSVDLNNDKAPENVWGFDRYLGGNRLTVSVTSLHTYAVILSRSTSPTVPSDK